MIETLVHIFLKMFFVQPSNILTIRAQNYILKTKFLLLHYKMLMRQLVPQKDKKFLSQMNS